MICKQYQRSIILLSSLILATTTFLNCHNVTTNKALKNSSIKAIFVFGDSTVDPGNNDYLKTLFKGNFPPYGVDFPKQIPTGRLTNGRLPTDFIASYIGIKEYVPAYLDPNLSFNDLKTGVSFASAGTGYDPITAKRNKVIDLVVQLQFFDEYKNKLERLIGKKRMDNTIKNAAYIISCGTNDFVYTYGLLPDLTLVADSISAYQDFIIEQNNWFLEALIDRGARRIGVVGLPPVGCLPVIITFHSTLLHQPRSCFQALSSIARDFNQMLQHQLITIQSLQPNTTISYGDIYTPLEDQFSHPYKYGFEVSDKGCCGTGLIEGAIACNSLIPICNDRSKYIFWDSIHPTEKSYYYIFKALIPTIDQVFQQIK